MKYVTLAEVKAQTRVDFDAEDELLTLYADAAEVAVVDATRRTGDELCQLGYAETHDDGMPEEADAAHFPSRLKVAILLTAANWYRNREPVAGVQQHAVPYTLEALIKPYVRLG
jgi:hypothetical protein